MKTLNLLVTAVVSVAVMGTANVLAEQKIDIVKYDIVNIYRNVSDKAMKRFIKDEVFQYGDSPYKVLKEVKFGCTDLGFSASDPDYAETSFPDHLNRHYEKVQNEELTSTCDESDFKNAKYDISGSHSFAMLIDGSD
jgi:hypothetical protein